MCDTIQKTTKSKKEPKPIDSDLTHILYLRVCDQNKTKLLLIFSWFVSCFRFIDAFYCDISQNCTKCHTTKHQKTNKKQKKHENS